MVIKKGNEFQLLSNPTATAKPSKREEPPQQRKAKLVSTKITAPAKSKPHGKKDLPEKLNF